MIGITNGQVDNASRFFNSTDMEYALREAERLYLLDPQRHTDANGKIVINIDFGRPVGDGYIKNSNANRLNGTAGEYRWTNVVSVGLDRETKKPYTAFPDIVKEIKNWYKST